MNIRSRQLLQLFVVRLLFSAPFLVLAIVWFTPVGFSSILAVFLLIPPGLLLAEPIVLLFSEPTGSVFHPRGRDRTPRLRFSMAEARMMEGHHREALDLLLEMAEQHPNRLEIYLKMLKLGAEEMESPDVAREAFRAGMRNLEKLEDRSFLAGEYKRLTASLDERE